MTEFIKNIIETIKPEQLELTEQYDIPQIHNGCNTIMHDLLSELYTSGELISLYPNIPNITDYNIFCDWYFENPGNITKEQLQSLNMNERAMYLYDSIYPVFNDRYELADLLYGMSLAPINIMHQSEINELVLKTYQNSICNMWLYMLKDDDGPDVKHIELIMSVMNELGKLTNYTFKKMKLVVFYSNIEKRFHMWDANNAVTIANNYVYVWRSEEFYKVLIHELIHYYRLEGGFNKDERKELHDIVLSRFCFDGADNPYEAYTELLAIHINNLMISHLNGKHIDWLFKNDIEFTLHQTSKLIKYYGGTEWNDVYSGHIIIHQKTNICSYWFVKLFMMVNYDKIEDFWKNYGLALNRNNKHIYTELMSRLLDRNIDDVNIEIINNLIISNGPDRFSKYTDSFRMTINDVEL